MRERCTVQCSLDGKLGLLPGGEVHLTLDANAEPVIRPPRTLPESRRDLVKAELDRLEDTGVIVKTDQPTDWVSQMSVADKKSGEVRICIDPRPLNLVLKREQYMLPVLDDILPQLAGGRVFSVCDLKQGYLHCELDEESSLLTTFATPFGRYRWLRLPFGVKVSSEIFQKRLCQALERLEGAKCIADDVIIYGKDVADHNTKLCQFLQRCGSHGIKLNREKCQFQMSEIKFLGHVVSTDGLKPDPNKVEAIVNMERPTDVEAVERLKGTVAYLARFVPKLTDVMRPITVLTHKGVEWNWSNVQDKAFAELKKLMTEAPVLVYFDPTKQLVIQCDASGQGIGAALLQDGQPIAYVSRAFTDAETRYSTIEKEMLAIVFSLEKWHQFTYGRHVIVNSDHKPLQAITRKTLDRAPKRLQGMLVRALAYDIDVHYLEGKKMLLADTLSRAHPPKNNNQAQAEFENINALSYLPMGEERVEQIRKETETQRSLKLLKETIKQGWPEKNRIPTLIGEYYGIRDELEITEGLIFRGERLVIPQSLRKAMIADIHEGHTGVESCLGVQEKVYFGLE